VLVAADSVPAITILLYFYPNHGGALNCKLVSRGHGFSCSFVLIDAYRGQYRLYAANLHSYSAINYILNNKVMNVRATIV
jgi:hypothetical protein